MITKKLKQTGLIFVVGVIGLGTVTTALLAYHGPAAKPTAVSADSAAQDGQRNKAHESKTIPAPKTSPEEQSSRENQERARAEADIEASHQRLDVLLAEAALNQIELDMITNRIEQSTEFIEGPESRFFVVHQGLTEKERGEAMRRFDERRITMREQLRSDRERYATKWTELARLKRDIVRQSRTLGVTTELAPTGNELGRRVDGLERKIDRIIDSLPAR